MTNNTIKTLDSSHNKKIESELMRTKISKKSRTKIDLIEP